MPSSSSGSTHLPLPYAETTEIHQLAELEFNARRQAGSLSAQGPHLRPLLPLAGWFERLKALQRLSALSAVFSWLCLESLKMLFQPFYALSGSYERRLCSAPVVHAVSVGNATSSLEHSGTYFERAERQDSFILQSLQPEI